MKHFGTFRLLIPSSITDQQKKMLEKLDVGPSSIPSTPLLKSTLSGIPILGANKDESISYDTIETIDPPQHASTPEDDISMVSMDKEYFFNDGKPDSKKTSENELTNEEDTKPDSLNSKDRKSKDGGTI